MGKTSERMIKIKEKDYRNMKNAVRRQEKAKVYLRELWRLFNQTKKAGSSENK